MLKTTIPALCAAAVLLLFACSKKDAGGSSAADTQSRFQVYLTDDPGDYEGVYIDVRDVRMNYSSDTANGWESLAQVKKGTYNLLTLTNDKDTLLADALLKPGKLEQVRIILGPDNFVKVNGEMIPLTTPSAQQSGLKIKVRQDMKEGMLYKVLLDFDVARSVYQTGNKKYMLKPVIRAVLQAVGADVKGFVRPDSVQTAVLAIKGTDTVASTYTSGGGFLIKGIGAGTYDFHFLPTDSTYKKLVKTGVNVTVSGTTAIDTVILSH